MPRPNIKKASWTLTQAHMIDANLCERTIMEEDDAQQTIDNQIAESGNSLNIKKYDFETKSLSMVSNPTITLRLSIERSEKCLRLPSYFYNALLIELRDMFRMLDGMTCLSEQSRIQVEHLTSFYEWFEGFFGMVTSLFDTEEDILFSWVEKIGSAKLKNGLSPKRRKTKKQRVKELCFDIFDLKIQFSRSCERFINIGDLLKELLEEAEHLSLRILSYISLCRVQVTTVIQHGFNEDEKSSIDASFLGNLKASGPGKFLICAVARGIAIEANRISFLEDAFKAGKITKSSILSYERKYRKNHSELVEKLAIHPLETEYL